MMLIITCARGVQGKFDKNGGVWCILSVPKIVIINLKINPFFTINKKPKFCAIFISKINPDAHFGTKINTFTFYKGGGGLIALRSQRNAIKMEALQVFFQQILHTGRKDISCNDVDSDSCYGCRFFFFIKSVQYGAF